MKIFYLDKRTKRFLLWFTVLFWGLVNLTGALCFAQTGPPVMPTTVSATTVGGGTGAQRGRWQTQPSLTIYEQYSDNVDLLHENQVSAWRTQLIPSISFIRPTPRRQLKLDLNLKLDYRDKDDGTEETFYWYDMYGYLGQEISPRTSYEIVTSFDVGYTESSVEKPFVNVFGATDRSTSFTIGPAIRYKLTRTTLSKLGYKYTRSDYTGSDALDANEHSFALYLEQKLGSRVIADVGGIYNVKTFSDNTGYTDIMIPFGVSLDLIYTQLRLGGVYLNRSFDDPSKSTVTRLGYQLGFGLGGSLLRLKATSVELTYKTNFYNDIFGEPYENQEWRLGVFHAFRKNDVYFYTRYGKNSYMQISDEITYWGGGGSWKYRISNVWSVECRLDYDTYSYQPAGNDYNITRSTVETSYYLSDVWLSGFTYRHTVSTGNQDEANYDENLYAVFLRAVW